MKSFSKWGSALAVLFLLAGTAMGSDALATGKIKGINANKGEFVLTDSAGKDVTFKLSDKVVVNRGGKESKSDLKAGDAVNVSYDKGLATSTAKYILVQEGDRKKWDLAQGSFKSYDATKKEIICTDAQGKDCTYAMGDAKVRMNNKKAKVEDIKIGEHVLCIIPQIAGDKKTLQALMFERAK
ncbi:MAG: hypothetical protein ABSG67_18240 [Thermoguttaceae bacterium]|jgi:hypothetical protein